MHECDDTYGPFVVVNRVENAVTLNEALSHLFAYGFADIKVAVPGAPRVMAMYLTAESSSSFALSEMRTL